MTTIRTLTRPASLTEVLERRSQTIGPVQAESRRRGLAYQAQGGDLFISPSAKCGTTWLLQIVHSLRTRGDMDFDDILRVIPWLETTHSYGVDLDGPQPGGFRVFKSHLSWANIPKGGRYIVSFRDPKDALVSLYNFLNDYWWQAGAVSISEFARANYLPHQHERWDGCYWGHLVSWWEQRHNPQVLLLSYEGMKADLPATVATIAHFLDIELDQDLLKLVLEHASLEFMLAHKSKFAAPLMQEAYARQGYLPPSDDFATVNTGRVGDHRTELPVEIGAEMDAIWRETVEPKTGLASYQDLRMALA
jgi:hypothetical protein